MGVELFLSGTNISAGAIMPLLSVFYSPGRHPIRRPSRGAYPQLIDAVSLKSVDSFMSMFHSTIGGKDSQKASQVCKYFPNCILILGGGVHIFFWTILSALKGPIWQRTLLLRGDHFILVPLLLFIYKACYPIPPPKTCKRVKYSIGQIREERSI